MVILKIQKMTMTEKFKILSQYIKDMSSETADIETFLFVKENIRKYQLNIDINSKAIKNNLIEVNVTLKFEDKEPNEKKSYFEIVYATIIRLVEKIEDKKELEKIILSDVPTKIFPNLEKAFLNIVHDSGYPGIKLEKKIDFNKLYNEKFN